ncbi:hypothetical protein GE09DRAFT_1209689 [Coniochaeta sp. 2T2.1]|nr:hypothetical protein GE09DRAFT_1209689 [Coniochaeta sp. 2T2.1]
MRLNKDYSVVLGGLGSGRVVPQGKYEQIQERYLALNNFLNKESPVSLLMGAENSRRGHIQQPLQIPQREVTRYPSHGGGNCRRNHIQQLVELSATDELVWLELDVLKQPEKVLVERPYFALIRNKTTRSIKQLVFLAWHPRHFLVGRHQTSGPYHDLPFNLHAYEKRTGNLDEATTRNLLPTPIHDKQDLFPAGPSPVW